MTEALSYDSFGNVSTDAITGINMTVRNTNMVWSNGTYTTGQFPLSVQDPSGAVTYYTYNYNFGEPATVTDPNNLVTTWNTWDDFGRPTKMTNPDGTYITWQYLNSATYLAYDGVLLEKDLYASNSTLIQNWQTAYDSVDRTRVKLNYGLSGSYNRADITYDSLGRVSQQSFPCTFSAWTTTCTYWNTNSYDVLNRLTQTQRPISSTDSTLQTTTLAYAGRTTTITDPYSNSNTIVTDVNGWQRETKDAYSYTVTTAYDAAGSRTGLTESARFSPICPTCFQRLAPIPSTMQPTR